MGEWRIEIDGGPSGHGCDRNAKESDVLTVCGRKDCPDCLLVETLVELQKRGLPVRGAKFRHWPGTQGEVEDVYGPADERGNVVGQRWRGDFRP